MAGFRVTEGSVTVELSGELEGFVRRLVERTQTATIIQLRAASEEVAAEARAEWYGPSGVTRRTGKTGSIVSVETVDIARGEIRVSTGSTDTRMAGRKPVPVYVHRPNRTSTILVDVTPAEWYAAPASLRGPWRPGPTGKKIATMHRPNPEASDGKFLLPLMVRGPMKKRAKAITAAIAKEVARGQ